jgi:hypothetical protein
MSDAQQYEAAWREDEEPSSKRPAEAVKEEALQQLAADAMEFTNEAIRDRNTSPVSEEIKRAHNLYNASAFNPNTDEIAFEGTRTAVESGSKVVQNIIRPLTNDGASQLGDMLYPTDTENWGATAIYPAAPPLGIQNEQAMSRDGEPLTDGEDNPVSHLSAWQASKVAIDHKTKRMHAKIKLTLERNKMGKLGRQLINDGARTGTAILKAPYVDQSVSKHWAKGSSKTYSLYTDTSKSAALKTISVLDFLPEMAASTVGEAAYITVREWYLPRNLRKLKRAGKYNQEALDRLLKHKPRYQSEEATAEGKQERLSIMDTALVEKLYNARFEVFETWGEFSVSVLKEAGVEGLKEDSADTDMVTACIVHCDGECLRAFLNPLESGELPFSVWCWDDDPTSIFGKGIPILAENCQLIYNAVWRMILDHGGLSAVPMISYLKGKVTPAGSDKSDYSLRGGKAWEIVSDMFNLPDGSANGKVFEVHDIPIHLDQFFAIMEKAEDDAYKLTGVTRVNRTEAGVDNAPLTLGATQIYQNNSSVARRRQVRDFDDDITKDALTRIYDFHMQHEADSESKVLMEIEPRGSSVLLQRELNTQNLINLYQITGNGQAEGVKGVEMLREVQSGMQFPEGKFVESAVETEARRQQETENPPTDPELTLRQQELDQAKEKNEADVEIAYTLAEIKGMQAQAQAEQASIDSERTHYREMIKTEKMSESEGNKLMAGLQAKQEEIASKMNTQLRDIQSRRDIAAGSMLSKESVSGADGSAKILTAQAKMRDSETRQKEIDGKLSGRIEEGI